MKTVKMVQFRWIGGSSLARLRLWFAEEYFMMKMAFYSLFHNSLTTWSTVMDAALEPMFWFVDHFIRYLGPAFVVLVIVLTTSVVVIFYICLLPHKMAESKFWTVYHLICGHWCLINIIFHYFKAAFTNPGNPPHQIPEVVSICKKCITPKPPRTHHCSVCNRCIFKMDHHCPWLNNCVGHLNHRYFFMFCVYMWVGTIYVSISAYPLFKEHFYGTDADAIGWSGFFYPYHIAMKGAQGGKLTADLPEEKDDSLLGGKREELISSLSPPTRDTTGIYFHNFIIYEFMLCTAVSLALGVLVFWHARLISRAETSIEVHLNRSECARQSKLGNVYRNPYDFGLLKNWKIFLGITNGRTFFRHILLPSSHKPDEDGLTWRTRSSKSHQGILLL